jgi:hypothetical protein
MPTTKARLLSTLINNDGDVKLTNLDTVAIQDSADVISAAPSGMTVYTTLDSLPTTNLTSGDQAYVSANNRMYISNGSGWYNVALVNLSPTMSLDQSGTIVLNADTLSATVTITAQDSDNPDAILSFSVESDGNMLATGVTVSQDSSVFTITSLTEDSGAVAGNFDLTFKTTDNINTASEVLSFSLAFSNVVDSSSATTFLLKATGNTDDNYSITYVGKDSAGDVIGTTETGSPYASTFTPYRSGGYSLYFSGAEAGKITSADNGIFDCVANDNMTIEFWLYPKNLNSSTSGDLYIGQGGNLWIATDWSAGGVSANKIGVAYWDRSWNAINSTTTVVNDQWYHVAMTYDGTNIKLYLDGQLEATSGSWAGYANSESQAIGGWTSNGYVTEKYMTDIRVSHSIRYTGNFTPPARGTLANDSNTKSLFGSAAVKDDGSSAPAWSFGAAIRTIPFGPDDYSPWADSDGGAIHIEKGEFIQYTSDTAAGGISNFGTSTNYGTLECWVYITDYPSTYQGTIWGKGGSSLSGGYWLGLEVSPDGTLRCAVNSNYNSVTGMIITTEALVKDQWYHLALVTNTTTWTVYINGKASGSVTPSAWTSNSEQAIYSGRLAYDTNAGRQWAGLISNLKISTSTSSYSTKYTGAFTTYDMIAPTWDSDTALLLTGANDANMYDATGGNHLRPEGDPQSSTTQRKFDTSSSVYFDGNDRLRLAMDGTYGHRLTTAEFGTSDWTVEGWIYPTAGSSQYIWGDVASSGANSSASHFVLYNSTGITAYNYTNGNVTLTGTETAAAETWHHIAVTREGSTFRLFVNGVLDTSATNANAMNNTSVDYAIGGVGDFASYFTGYIQDFRITKGKARYTATFTPPTAEFEL